MTSWNSPASFSTVSARWSRVSVTRVVLCATGEFFTWVRPPLASPKPSIEPMVTETISLPSSEQAHAVRWGSRGAPSWPPTMPGRSRASSPLPVFGSNVYSSATAAGSSWHHSRREPSRLCW